MSLKQSEAIVSAHLSAARIRPAGDAVHARRRQGQGRGARGQEIQAPLWRSAGAADVGSRLLRRSRGPGAGAAGFVRHPGVAAVDRDRLPARRRAGARGRNARRACCPTAKPTTRSSGWRSRCCYQLRSGSIWMPLTYFQLWLVRLVGFLPELGECMACGADAERQQGVLSRAGRRPDVRAAQAAGVVATGAGIAELWRRRCFARPVGSFTRSSDALSNSSGAAQYADLRKFLVQIIERHLEKKLVTAAMLAKL